MARDDDDDDIEDEDKKDLIRLKKNDVMLIVGSLIVGIVIGYFLKKIFDKHGYHNLPPGVMYAPPWHGACTRKHVDETTAAAMPKKDYIESVPGYNKQNMVATPEGYN